MAAAALDSVTPVGALNHLQKQNNERHVDRLFTASQSACDSDSASRQNRSRRHLGPCRRASHLAASISVGQPSSRAAGAVSLTSGRLVKLGRLRCAASPRPAPVSASFTASLSSLIISATRAIWPAGRANRQKLKRAIDAAGRLRQCASANIGISTSARIGDVAGI